MGLEFAVLLLDIALPTIWSYIPGPAMTMVYIANALCVGLLLKRLMSPVYSQ